MLNSIMERHGRLNPYTETEISIIRSATKLFLENGYTKTTFKMIEADSGIKIGNITYYFHSKEELFKVLVEELIEYHVSLIDDMYEESNDNSFAFAMEIAAQIALCENDSNAWDIYYSAYSMPHTFDCIKEWEAKKNYTLFKNSLSDWTEQDFRDKELVASGIELAALKTFCNRDLSLNKKISLILDSMLMLYEVPKEKRKGIIEKVLATNYCRIAEEMFAKFSKRLDNDTKKQ